MSPLKAILFDFDGLILDTEYPEYVSWCEIYQELGLDLPIADWAAIIGRGASTVVRTPYDEIEERLQRPIDRAAIRARRRARFSELMVGQEIRPGVVALVEEAQKQRIKLGVVSSSSREWVVGYLDGLGLTAVFDVLCCGGEVARTKPAPDLYLTALRTLGLSAGEAIALEDSANGITAAKAAGLFCIAVPNDLTRHADLNHADQQIDSLAEITLAELAALLPD